jgi:anti-sigma regulatory factor (Ser/Thr protein kinase)
MNDDRATAAADASRSRAAFRHELYPYDGDAHFLAGALSFIDDALAGDELVLVAVAEPKERMLRAELAGTRAEASVSFLDTAALGRNPGRLIPAWQEWITARVAAGHEVRGIGESQWGGGSAVEVAELQYHEWLLNRAFAKSPAWWLLCPYDTTVLEPTLLESARRCHPLVLASGAHGPSDGYVDEPYAFEELSSPGDPHQVLSYSHGDLPAVREKVAAYAAGHGVDGARLQGLLVAATEVAANSIKHGGGRGTLRTWSADSSFTCEFHDSGYIEDPLVGRIRPTPEQIGGRGMWLVHQLCDLVQIRSAPATGTTIRLHTIAG